MNTTWSVVVDGAGGIIALALLLLFPGVLVVRAPWPAVPFLSLSFWFSSWYWLEALGRERERFLASALPAFIVVAALRLLKPLGLRRPTAGTLVVVALALGHLTPLALTEVAPAPDAPVRAATVRLLVSSGHLPRSGAPLLPTRRSPEVLGTDLLAADLSLMSGLAPHRAAFLAAATADGLVGLALLFFFVRSGFGALSAPLALLLAGLAGLGPVGDSRALGLSLCIVSWSLLGQGDNRAPAVAAGVMAAAAALSDANWLTGLVACAAVTSRLGRPGLARESAMLSVGLALLLLVPAALVSVAGEPRLAFHVPALSLPGLALALVVATSFGAARLVRAHRPGPRAALASAVVVALVGGGLGPLRARADSVPTPEDLAAAAWLTKHSRVSDEVCAGPGVPGAWLPALAGRRVRRTAVGGCRYAYLLAGAQLFPGGRTAFLNASVRIVEMEI